MEIQGGPEQDVRVTRLEYTAGQLTADRDVVWSNVTMIKGNSAKESSGWTVFTFDQYKFNATSGYVRQLYDGDGNWLKQMEQVSDGLQLLIKKFQNFLILYAEQKRYTKRY